MKIAGLQKLTLLDYPGKTACTVFTWGCNLRCPFCHNAGLVTEAPAETLTADELFAFLQKRRGLLDGVCITGGEPTLQPDLPDLIRDISDMGFAVKLDTNGTNPDILRQLCESGRISMVAMDIKNSPEKYMKNCGLEQEGAVDLEKIRESIRLIMEKAPDYEFRTTVVEEFHKASDFEEMGKMIAGAKNYFLQSFTDRDTVPFEGFHAPDPEDLKKYAEIVRKYVAHVEIRGVE